MLHHKGAVTLHTKRLMLRKFTLRDDYAMYENWASDPAVARFMCGKAHSSIAITRQVLESWCCHNRKKSYHWALVLKGKRDPVGSISFVDFNELTGEAEVGYTLSQRYWGRGLAAEALSAILDYGTKNVGFTSYYAQLFEGNTQSARVLEKCGFTFAERIEAGAKRNTGEPDTVLIYRRQA